ncbi:gamma-glutamyltransferase family protein [Ciceribacter azotifigens]|uniref:gamma-glutamyltransferase family protein n=1 Tax=Ciceribacter azotifigens TaxID=2069303 RepID=UPI003A8B95DD
MSLDTRFPYASRRVAQFGTASVATSQPVAAQAGIAALAAGGNAVDAALATAITLTVVEPTMNGLGGDLFALVHDGAKLHGLNSSGRSAKAWQPERLAAAGTMPMTGWDTVTVPGQVRGWEALHSRFGRLAWADLFETAIRYATDGFLVPHVVGLHWAMQANWFRDVPGFAEMFLPNGRPPEPGARFRNPYLASSLRCLAQEGADAFYRGRLANQIVAFAEETGGSMRKGDLEDHAAEWVEPMSVDFAGATIHELPPNGQGLTALIALALIERIGFGRNAATDLHVEIEATRRAREVVARTVGDPQSMRMEPAALLDGAVLDRLAGGIDPERARPADPIANEGWGTVYLCAADHEGMMVSLIQSNYRGFGSGLVVPGTGITLHNRGSCFVFEKGHPNEAKPCKRPFNTIIPGFMTRNGRPLAAFGVMGGGMQPQGHVQIAARLLARGENVQAAIDAPRWRIADDGTLMVEEDLPEALVSDLCRRGHQVVRQPRWDYQFGAAQAIVRRDDGYEAGTESRRDGCAAVI